VRDERVAVLSVKGTERSPSAALATCLKEFQEEFGMVISSRPATPRNAEALCVTIGSRYWMAVAAIRASAISNGNPFLRASTTTRFMDLHR